MKKILITGASGGIGSSIADKFLKNNYEEGSLQKSSYLFL